MTKIGRGNELIRLMPALWPLRLPIWLIRGPVGIRERSEIHIVDRGDSWARRVAKATSTPCSKTRAADFDPRLHRLLTRAFSRLPPNRIIDLRRDDVRG
jgi:hypothetical protein